MNKYTLPFSLNTFLFIVITFSLFISSLSWATDWELFFENNLHDKFYIDKSSVVITPEKNIRAWQKTESKTKKGTMVLYEVNCQERKYTIRAMEPIYKNDIASIKAYETVMRNWTEPNQNWEFVSTTDLDEATYAAIPEYA